MGYLTNQWIGKGTGEKSRKYSPVPVSVEARAAKQTPGRIERGIKLEIKGTRGDLSYQVLSMTQREADEIVARVLEACSDERRLAVAVEALRGLSDGELVRALSAALKLRSSSTEKKSPRRENAKANGV